MRRRTELRGSWKIIPDILRVISKEGEKAMTTRIMKGACLDWRGFEKYSTRLQEQGFIEKIKKPAVGTIYRLTERGIDLKMRLVE
ncbi:MAG: hypothetical protein IMF19_11695 [Proteobacteria bacterium]|nr:hypothetical protein [Pseudomonadota bacterium]